jgi:hypothetical protein
MGKEIPDFFGALELPFVILHHSGAQIGARSDHWDWLLDWPISLWQGESGLDAMDRDARWASDEGRLITFCSVAPPVSWLTRPHFYRLAPHRRLYLEYQGEVGGGRGFVQQVACGRICWHELSPTSLAFTIVHSDFRGAPSPEWQGASYFLQHDSCVRPAAMASDTAPAKVPCPTEPPRAWFCRDSDTAAEWTLRAAPTELPAPPGS